MAGSSGRDLLFLCHRIPYPPDKGDKVRSYRWLHALARAYRVHLAAFVDDPADWRHRPQVEALCASSILLPLRAMTAKLHSLTGLVTGEPLSLPYYRDRRLSHWLRALLARTEIGRVVVYSSAMAQYVVTPEFAHARRVIDFVDVDSDKWRQYAQARGGPMRWIYAREAARLEAFELGLARLFDVSLFVSAAEAHWFQNRLGAGGERVTYVNNGVDAAFFDPALAGVSPYPPGVRAVVFTGAMDYWPNEEAVTWFCREVWPRVLAEEPGAVFYIVGSRPGEAVHALASEAVVVTGRVPDVRPYLGHAAAVVAPMRIARGIQNKVLEGMAMARPVVVSTKGLEGISARHGRDVLVADEAEDVARRVCDVLVRGEPDLGSAARETVRREYAWEGSTRRLLELVDGERNSECGMRIAE